MQLSNEINKISMALVRAQAKIKTAALDSKNPHFGSKFASLGAVWNACNDALHENEISVLQGARSELDTYGVDTMLLHSSGQWIREILMLKPTKNDPQGAGSAITYARRYALAAMIGVMQEDDDANTASQGDKKATVASRDLSKPLTGSEAVERAKELINARNAPSSDAGNFTVSFGKYKDKKIRELPINDVINYVDYLLKMSVTNQKPLSPAANDFIINAKAFIAAASDAEDMPPPEYPQYDAIPIPFES